MNSPEATIPKPNSNPLIFEVHDNLSFECVSIKNVIYLNI